MSTNNMCLVFAVLIFIGCILSFKVSLGVHVEPVFQRCDYLPVCYGAYGVRNDSARVDITRVLGEIIGQSESSGSGAARNQLLSSSFPLHARTSLRAQPRSAAPLHDGTRGCSQLYNPITPLLL